MTEKEDRPRMRSPIGVKAHKSERCKEKLQQRGGEAGPNLSSSVKLKGKFVFEGNREKILNLQQNRSITAKNGVT